MSAVSSLIVLGDAWDTARSICTPSQSRTIVTRLMIVETVVNAMSIPYARQSWLPLDTEKRRSPPMYGYYVDGARRRPSPERAMVIQAAF
jgi:hypothetical protein